MKLMNSVKICLALSFAISSIAFGAEYKASEHSCAELQGLLGSEGTITVDSGDFGKKIFVASPELCGSDADAMIGYDLSKDDWYCRLGFYCLPKL